MNLSERRVVALLVAARNSEPKNREDRIYRLAVRAPAEHDACIHALRRIQGGADRIARIRAGMRLSQLGEPWQPPPAGPGQEGGT